MADRTQRTTRTSRPARDAEPEDFEDIDPTDRDEDAGPADLDEDEDDLFDDDDDDLQGARTGYVTFDDLLDRLLIVKPTDTFQREGDNGVYDVIVCDVIVCNGKPSDVMEEIPWVLEEYQFWGQNIVSTLKPALKHDRTVVGVLAQRKAKKYRNMAWHLDSPTADQLAKAKEIRRAVRRANRGKGGSFS